MEATQNEVVLSRLRKGPLTAYEAQEHYGIARLAARICDLRALGHVISSKRIEAPSRYGVAKVSSYSLVEPDPLADATHSALPRPSNHATALQR